MKFRTKIFIHNFYTTALVIILLVWLSNYWYGRRIVNHELHHTKEMAKALAVKSEEFILTRDLAGLGSACNNALKSHRNFVYAFVLQDDEILAHTFERGVPRGLLSLGDMPEKDRVDVTKVENEKGSLIYHVRAKLGDPPFATVHMGLSQEKISGQLTSFRNIILAVGGFLIIVVPVGLAYLFARVISKPIRELRLGSQRIGRGELDHRLNIESGDELEELAEEFNRMAEKIKGYYATLECQVEERTNHLKREFQERIRAQEELRIREERYNLAVSTGKVGVWDWNLDTNRIYLDPTLKAMLGYREEEIRDHIDDWLKRVHPEDVGKIRAAERAHLKGHTPYYEVEHRLIHKEGRVMWFLARGAAIMDASGNPYRMMGAYLDITERKSAEEALRESEAELSAIFDNVPVVMVLVDRERKVQRANLASLEFSGRTEDEIVGLAIGEALSCRNFFNEPEGCGSSRHCRGCRVFQTVLDTFETGLNHYKIEAALTLAPGGGEEDKHLLVSTTLLFVSGAEMVLVSIEDVTDRRKAEEALIKSEEKYRSIYENAQVGLFRTRLSDGKILECNERLAQMFAYKDKQECLRDFVASKNYLDPGTREKMLERLEKNGEINNFDARFARKDGTPVWVRYSAKLYTEKGYLEGVAADITEQKLAEESLAAEKERLRVTLRSIGDGVIATDTEGRVVLINKVAEELTGWGQYDATGRHLTEVFHLLDQETRTPLESPVKKVLETGGTVVLEKSTILVAKDGAERLISDSCTPIRDSDSKVIGVVMVFSDVTEKHRLEGELLKMEKLESVGVLAGGIAHDFNNILTSILGNISLAKMSAQPGEEVFELLAESEKASMRARDLTQQLLTFSKGGTPVRETASVAEVIQDSAGFALRGSNVSCRFELPEDLWPVDVDVGQINQVVHNLIINADQAMPQGGTIEISAENFRVQPGHHLPLEVGNYVKIAMRDQGIGIAEEYLSKIFDPFFTTKNRGSGLGLATAYSIVKNHGGHLTVESPPGEGTTFYIYLHASQKTIMPEGDAEAVFASGEGKVLVMDDEEMVRRSAGMILSRVGFSVDFAREGGEAIELYLEALEKGEPFNIVIMDLTVPGGMGGREAIMNLREIDPDVKAIVSSGYSTDPVMADFQSYGFSGVVAKPYEVKELVKTVAKLMEA